MDLWLLLWICFWGPVHCHFWNFRKINNVLLIGINVTPKFCFAFKIPDNVTATNMYVVCTSEALLHTPSLQDNWFLQRENFHLFIHLKEIVQSIFFFLVCLLSSQCMMHFYRPALLVGNFWQYLAILGHSLNVLLIWIY